MYKVQWNRSETNYFYSFVMFAVIPFSFILSPSLFLSVPFCLYYFVVSLSLLFLSTRSKYKKIELKHLRLTMICWLDQILMQWMISFCEWINDEYFFVHSNIKCLENDFNIVVLNLHKLQIQNADTNAIRHGKYYLTIISGRQLLFIFDIIILYRIFIGLRREKNLHRLPQ